MVVRTGGAEDPLGLQKVDFGQPFYASKSFYDAAKNRQVLFGWVKEMVATGATATNYDRGGLSHGRPHAGDRATTAAAPPVCAGRR